MGIPFRECFEEQGIGGKSLKKNPQDRYGEYFRKIENQTIREEKDRTEVLALFGETFTKNSLVVVKVRNCPESDDAFHEFLKSLKMMRHCVFVG